MEVSLNKAYKFITSTLKDDVKEMLLENLTEKDLEKHKTDFSENASIEIVRLFLESGKTKEEFCDKTLISLSRLNKALTFVLSSEDKKLESYKERILSIEDERNRELDLIEKLIVNYDRKQKNINLLEFQSFATQPINKILLMLKERKSYAQSYLNELYKEYNNRVRLASFTFTSLREMKTTINGRVMTDEDYDIIEEFFIRNKYPKQRAIYTYVREAYLNGNIEDTSRENVKKRVMERFNLTEEPKKYH